MVPPAALDVLAPIVCERAAVKSKSHLKIRKWLAALLRASLLSESAKGVSVHDLVRDVMITRVEAGDGGMVTLQRDVLRLFLEAYDKESTEMRVKEFIVQGIRHHVAHAQQPGALHEDELIMSVLTHKANVICARAVAGIGRESLETHIAACQDAGKWFEAAQLWFAASTQHGQKAGAELILARTALERVQAESKESRLLEVRILNRLMFASEGGYKAGSVEHGDVIKRLAALTSDDIAGSDEAKFDALIGEAVSRWVPGGQKYNMLGYTPISAEALLQAHSHFMESADSFERAALVAGNLGQRLYALSHYPLFGMHYHQIIMVPGFNYEMWAGKGCQKMRTIIDDYDFDLVHAESKSTALANDLNLCGHNEMGVLLWSGDVELAKAGWRKQIEARKKIWSLVQNGERTWDEYTLEELQMGFSGIVGGMLAAGDMGMVREFMQHSVRGIAIRDPAVASEVTKVYRTTKSPWSWEGPDGYCSYRVETMFLQARAIAAVADDGVVDAEALRAWLPRPDELIYIAEHEWIFNGWLCGAAHPTVLCASLYATCLNAWDDAEVIVTGVLAIAPQGDGKGFGTQPLVRIEAWRLLARCRIEYGNGAGACEALESAVRESQAAGFVWMEVVALQDMLQFVGGPSSTSPERITEDKALSSKRIHERIDAVKARWTRKP